MARRNSRQHKAERRRRRAIRHVGGCSVCGSKDVVWVDEGEVPDPNYRAICAPHLGYALTTLFWGETIPDELPVPERRERELPILIQRARRELAEPIRRPSPKKDRRRLGTEVCLQLVALDENPPELPDGIAERLQTIDR